MALTPVAYIPAGCSLQCPKNVATRSSNNTFAYASIHGISLYRMERKSLPNLSVAAADPAAVIEVPTYALQTLYGSGVNATVAAFDYNEEIMACLCPQSKNVVVWGLADAEPLTAKKIPASLAAMFRREGTPSTMCVAGKYHLIFGTTTGRLVSLNTNAGPNDPRCVTIPAAGGGTAENVECVAVSPSRADLIAAGTSDGILSFLTLSAAAGLTVAASMIPFPPPAKEKDRLLAPNALPVNVIAYDPATPTQIAVGSAEGGLVLCEMSSPAAPTVVFDTKDKINGLAWVTGQSGVFYSVSASSNVIQKWSTGGGRSPVAAIPAVGSELGIRSIACLDADRVVLGLTNGAVRVFNVSAAAADATTPTQQQQQPKQALEFETVAGHTDAVLTANFSRHDRDLMASAGTDGTIKVWNLKAMTLQSTIEVGQMLVYSIDWSPNGKYIIAAFGNGEVVQYNVATQRQGWRTAVFPDLVYRVLWSAAAGESSMIVATSRNGVALLNRDGQVVRRFASPGGAVYGVDIEPTRGKTLAVGCNNHKVYVYSLASNSDDPVLTLSGHSDVVSDVAFNLTAPQFLLSGSYDGTLRVFDLASNDSHTISVNARVLKGHSDRVKSVAWCSLAPYLALSGSADATIRLWDIRNGVCVSVVRGHSGDVCAITSHPERPLVFVSASRDGSFVAWFLALVRQVYLDAAMGTLDQCIVPDAGSLMTMATSGSVSVSVVGGAAVQKLARDLRDGAASLAERLEKISGFFEFPLGTADLSQLVTFAADPATYAGADGKTTLLVVPTAKLVETRRAKAKYAAEKARGKTVTSAGAEYKKKRLLEAAEELLRVGHTEDCCSLLMEAEEWDRAVAVAPAISRACWREVCLRAAAAMEAAGDARAVSYYIIAEESARAAALLSRASQENADAAAVVARTCPQRHQGAGGDAEPARQSSIDAEGQTPAARSAQESRMSALYHLHNPRVIAAAHVSSGANDAAVRSLLHAGDAILAHLLVHAIPLREQTTIDAAFHQAMLLSARLRQWDMAVTCASRQSNPYHSFATLIALFQFTNGKQVSRVPTQSVTSSGMASVHAVNDKLKAFYEQVRAEYSKLQLPMDAAAIQQRHASDGLASQNQVAAMVLQSDAMMGTATSGQVLQSIHGFLESLLGVALQDVDGANAAFYLRQAFNVSGYVALPISLPPRAGSSEAAASGGNSAANTTLAPEHKKFLCLAYLIGALMCLKVYRFPSLLNHVFGKARELTCGDAALEALVGKVHAALNMYSTHSVEVSTEPVGSVIPAMSSGDGRQLVSAVTAQPIVGLVYLLEDSVSLMSKAEVLAWSMCCHFSPLGSGARVAVL